MLRATLSLIICAALISCGGEPKKEAKSTSEVKEETTIATNEAEEVVEEKEKELIEIELIAQGEDMTAIAFEPKNIDIPEGSRVKLTFVNKSQAPGMYHNFVLVTLGKGQDIATAGIQAGKDNSFVPKSQDVIVYTEVLEMGATTTIEFDAPKKGSYHYICTYPGHYPNMIGRLNVQ